MRPAKPAYSLPKISTRMSATDDNTTRVPATPQTTPREKQSPSSTVIKSAKQENISRGSYKTIRHGATLKLPVITDVPPPSTNTPGIFSPIPRATTAWDLAIAPGAIRPNKQTTVLGTRPTDLKPLPPLPAATQPQPSTGGDYTHHRGAHLWKEIAKLYIDKHEHTQAQAGNEEIVIEEILAEKYIEGVAIKLGR